MKFNKLKVSIVEKGFYKNNYKNRKLGRVGQEYDKEKDKGIKFFYEAPDKYEDDLSFSEAQENHLKYVQLGENQEIGCSTSLENANSIQKKNWIKGLDFYIRDGFMPIREYEINNNLPNYIANEISKKEIVNHIENIEDFINNNKIKENIYIFRCLDFEDSGIKNPFLNMEIGDTFTDKSFGSFSFTQMNGVFGNYILKLKAKKGDNIACIKNFGELEFIANKNTTYKILKKDENGLVIEIQKQ